MELYKDGITMDVNSESQQSRLRKLGYRAKGEDHDFNDSSIHKVELEKIKQEAERKFAEMQEEISKKDAEIQRLTRQIEKLKKG